MAYRRKQQQINPRSSTFQTSRINQPPSPSPVVELGAAEPLSLAAQAIRASSVHRDSSISSAYGEPSVASAQPSLIASPPESGGFGYTSMNSLNESKYGFWGVLARKAKTLIEDDNMSQNFQNSGRKKPQTSGPGTDGQFQQSDQSPDNVLKAVLLPAQKSRDSIASSLSHIGGTIKNALEEGLTVVENRTAGIIQETRKLNIRRKNSSLGANQATKLTQHIQADNELQLKASRDVANAMAAKAKLLLRELKTVKADLAFAKERCAQLEEENKMLRESHEKAGGPEDDDLVRLQLETLLAEKGRLAHENSFYSRENRFLREIVEYHQLTMQDVVYVDEGIEEVTEVFSNSPNKILSRTSSISTNTSHSASVSHEHPPMAVPVLSTPTKPTASVVPEACLIIPLPPTPAGVVSPDIRATMHSSTKS